MHMCLSIAHLYNKNNTTLDRLFAFFGREASGQRHRSLNPLKVYQEWYFPTFYSAVPTGTLLSIFSSVITSLLTLTDTVSPSLIEPSINFNAN